MYLWEMKYIALNELWIQRVILNVQYTPISSHFWPLVSTKHSYMNKFKLPTMHKANVLRGERNSSAVPT